MAASKSPVVLFIAIFLIALAFGQSTGKTVRHQRVPVEDTTPPELAQAETSIEKQDYQTAEPLLQKVVAAKPENYQAWFDLGFVYNGLGKSNESIAAYRKSVSLKPDVFESNLNLGIMLAKAGQPDAEQFLRAATHLTPTANIDEGHARAWLSLGQVLATTKPDEALQAYQQAATLKPKDPEPHLSAASMLEGQDRFADAAQEYKLALAADPASTEALTGLANIYLRGQRFAEAGDVLRKLVLLHPDDAASHAQLAGILLNTGKNDEAIAELETAAKLGPNDAAVARALADAYVTAGKYDRAQSQYQVLLSSQPNNAELHHGLGVVLLKLRRFSDAQQEFLNAVRLKPDFGAAWGDLAVAADQNQQYELAIKAADMRAKFLPEVPVSYFLRATAYDHLRDYKQAAENYRKFLELASGQYPDQEWQARHRLIAIEPKK